MAHEADPPSRGAITRVASRVLVTFLVVFGVEAALVLVLGSREFLSWQELVGYLLAAASLLLSVVLVVHVVGEGLFALLARGVDGAKGARRFGVALGAVTAMVASPLLVQLTAGRRVRDLAVRPLLVVVSAALVFGGVTWLARRSPSWSARRRAVAGTALAVVAALADAFVLPRLYPAFHLGLAGLLVACACFVGLAVPLRLPRRRAWVVLGLGVLALPVSIASLARLARSTNTGFVVERHATVTGEALHLATRFVPPAVSPAFQAPAFGAAIALAPGIDLRDRDVLLITVDALRADRLAAYGGHGLTPNLDTLSREAVVFERAYTPTPHTSYALASLLTGKYMRPVLELPNASAEHATLPELLRRYGYRTAAFYPPAIFFVDAQRFGSLAEEGFGFEYRKQMFAPAADRVRQLREYLATVPAERPVFVWVHLFEPHEPYDPPAPFRRGDGPEERYDGEVAAADAAIGELVRVFRGRHADATVIVTADHGEEFGEHGGAFHGSTLYDEQVRVPLLWSSPGLAPPHSVGAPVELVDLGPTLLAAAGIPRDARMRGDDLGPLLRDPEATGPRHAFADIADARLVTDGRVKGICGGAGRCEWYDLVADPAERHNLAGSLGEREAELRGALSAFVASIPEVEAMAMAGGAGWPPALARAELGDVTVGPEVVPLLGDARAEVRAAAARATARLHVAPAVSVLGRLAAHEADPLVRAEATLAAFVLGESTLRDGVVGLLEVPGEEPAWSDVRFRAALALADADDASGAWVLASVVTNEQASEDARRRAVLALGRARARDGVPALVTALDDVRLRPDAAAALGAIGDARAAGPIAARLRDERYPPAREAEARALVALGDRNVERAIRRFLGMQTGLPSGVELLIAVNGLRRSGPSGMDVRGRGLVGRACDSEGCSLPAAPLALPTAAGRGEARLVVRIVANAGATVRLGSESFGPLPNGPVELAISCEAARCASIPIAATTGTARLVAFVLVPVQPEIPPPAPEPWDAGVPGAN